MIHTLMDFIFWKGRTEIFLQLSFKPPSLHSSHLEVAGARKKRALRRLASSSLHENSG